MIATKDIKEGTLLAVSKSFASGYEQDFPVHLIPEITEQLFTPSSILQYARTMIELQKNPQKAKELYNLYSGDDTVTNNEIPFGIVDAFRIENICHFNCFSHPDKDGQNSVYLHIPSSYFNHSCLANAFNSFHGDVMVIHAAADIKKGEEICLSYGSPCTAYSERRNNLKLGIWNFQCNCELCEIDANDKLCSKRDQMFEEFAEYVEANRNYPQKVISKCEQILKKIRETYVKRPQFQIRLIQIFIKLSPMYYIIGNLFKSMEYLEEALTLMDGPFKYGLDISLICANLSVWYAQNGNIEKAKEMIQNALKYSFCTDMEHFKMLFPDISLL